jgi:hypothetical protein
MSQINTLTTKSLASWSRFIAITFYVLLGFFALMMLIIIFFGAAGLSSFQPLIEEAMEKQGYGSFPLGNLGGAFLGFIVIIFLIFGVIIFLFAKYLLNFSKGMQAFSYSEEENHIGEGMQNLGKYFMLNNVLGWISIAGSLIALFGAIGLMSR